MVVFCTLVSKVVPIVTTFPGTKSVAGSKPSFVYQTKPVPAAPPVPLNVSVASDTLATVPTQYFNGKVLSCVGLSGNVNTLTAYSRISVSHWVVAFFIT